MKKYSVNENFFLTDSPESFYWAGFIAADGCVWFAKNKYPKVQVLLSEKDKDHLIKFKNSLKFCGNINKAGKGSLKICISSAQLANSLERFNIVPRKTMIYTFPKWLIDHSLVNHFMRGYNDGDGSFYLHLATNRKIKQLHIEICGTKDFLSNYRNILEKRCNIPLTPPSKKKNIYRLQCGGTRKSIKIRDFLYVGSKDDIMLTRKYNISHSESFVDLPENHKHKQIIRIDPKTNKHVLYNALKDVEKDGFSFKAVSNCIRLKCNTSGGFRWKYLTE